MIVAIDGPAGVGKSSLARAISQSLGFFYLNSGNFYRAIARQCLMEGVQLQDEKKIVSIAEASEFQIREKKLFHNGGDVEGSLHTQEIDFAAPRVSAIIGVRNAVNNHLRRIGNLLDLVAEGRDMTTVVFPEADVKLFLDARPEVRARRRYEERADGQTYEEILRSIIARDEIDRNKKFGALKQAPEAEYLDTSYLTIHEVCERVENIIKGKINFRSSF